MLVEGTLPVAMQTACLVLRSLMLALAAGVLTHLGVSWAIGPGWSSSLAVIGLVFSLALTLANRSD